MIRIVRSRRSFEKKFDLDRPKQWVRVIHSEKIFQIFDTSFGMVTIDSSTAAAAISILLFKSEKKNKNISPVPGDDRLVKQNMIFRLNSDEFLSSLFKVMSSREFNSTIQVETMIYLVNWRTMTNNIRVPSNISKVWLFSIGRIIDESFSISFSCLANATVWLVISICVASFFSFIWISTVIDEWLKKKVISES